MAFALGMEPAKKWSGVDDVNGGILWVKNDGSIVCHHLFERKELKENLFENTFFDTPSTTRHKYGFIYEYDGSYYFDLCLQVRFY
jgi:HpaII restriction endonuclease